MKKGPLVGQSSLGSLTVCGLEAIAFEAATVASSGTCGAGAPALAVAVAGLDLAAVAAFGAGGTGAAFAVAADRGGAATGEGALLPILATVAVAGTKLSFAVVAAIRTDGSTGVVSVAEALEGGDATEAVVVLFAGLQIAPGGARGVALLECAAGATFFARGAGATDIIGPGGHLAAAVGAGAFFLGVAVGGATASAFVGAGDAGPDVVPA